MDAQHYKSGPIWEKLVQLGLVDDSGNLSFGGDQVSDHEE